METALSSLKPLSVLTHADIFAHANQACASSSALLGFLVLHYLPSLGLAARRHDTQSTSLLAKGTSFGFKCI